MGSSKPFLDVQYEVPSGVVDGAPPPPARLLPASPNPFTVSTSIRFALAREGHCRIELFDLAGRRIRPLHDGPLPAGNQTVTWDGHDEHGAPAAPGVYFARLTAGPEVSRARLVRVAR
jgi:flagellar hook assembly protein FlgD